MDSPSLQAMAKDRRLWLFVLSGMLAFVVGFFSLSGDAAIVFVSRTGYWFILVTFVLWARSLGLLFVPEIRAWKPKRADWSTAALIGVCGLILIVNNTIGFKILMDEVMLLGTSMSMHFDRTVFTPTRGNDIQGAFILMDGIMDKRPLFFPFVLSLLHDFTGYRPQNAFVLNGVLTFVFLWLVSVLGRRLAGRPGAWLGVLLFASLPLLGQNATGGGFELLNLVMILATLLLAMRWLERRDEVSLTAFCFSALLMAQTRYESVVFLIPVGLLVLWGWIEKRRVILSWEVMLAPILLIPYPLQHRIFDLRASSWELAGRPGAETPFSLSYVSTNLAHAVAFFFAKPSDQPNSLVFSALGWIAVPFAALVILRSLRAFRELKPAEVAAIVFTLGFVAHFFLMMVYFWGRFDDVVIRRLSLPVHLGLLVAILLALPRFSSSMRPRWILAGIAALGLFALGIPAMATHAYDQEYLPGRETAWRLQFMAAHPQKDYLMIDNDCVLWITNEVSSTPVPQAQKNIKALIFHLRNHTYSAMYVFQRLNVDPKTGKETLREGDDLGPDFVLEPVVEQRLQTLTLSRISRIVAIRDGKTEVRAGLPKFDATVPKDPAEQERMRRAYLENFVKQLP